MAEPDWNPDTGGRSLAEILREANIESATRAARRRSWDDPEETGIRQRRVEAAAADRAAFGRRKSDLADAPPPRDRPDFSRPAPEPHTAAIPGMRPDRKPGVPTTTSAETSTSASTSASTPASRRISASDRPPVSGFQSGSAITPLPSSPACAG